MRLLVARKRSRRGPREIAQGQETNPVRSGNRGCSARIARSIPATSEPHRKWPKNASNAAGEVYPPRGGISFVEIQVARAAVGRPMSSPGGFAPSRINQKTSSATKRGSKERAAVFTSAKPHFCDRRNRVASSLRCPESRNHRTKIVMPAKPWLTPCKNPLASPNSTWHRWRKRRQRSAKASRVFELSCSAITAGSCVLGNRQKTQVKKKRFCLDDSIQGRSPLC